jgi:hypothetical protein
MVKCQCYKWTICPTGPTSCHSDSTEDYQPAKFHGRMSATYKHASVSKKTVMEWHQKFCSEQQRKSNEAWPVPMWPAMSRTCCAPCTGRCWTILHTAWTCHHVIFMYLAPQQSVKQPNSGWMKMPRLWWCSGSRSSQRISLQRGSTG